MNIFLPKKINQNTIETVYEMHAAAMYGCIFKIVQNKQKADDILMDIFRTFAVEFPNNNPENNQPIWYIKFAMKKAFHYLRQENDGFSSIITERINAIKTAVAQTASATA